MYFYILAIIIDWYLAKLIDHHNSAENNQKKSLVTGNVSLRYSMQGPSLDWLIDWLID